jgi:hypothetical protein
MMQYRYQATMYQQRFESYGKIQAWINTKVDFQHFKAIPAADQDDVRKTVIWLQRKFAGSKELQMATAYGDYREVIHQARSYAKSLNSLKWLDDYNTARRYAERLQIRDLQNFILAVREFLLAIKEFDIQ